MKHILTIVLNTLTSFNFNELNYFQGYHDITLLFLLLFINSPQTVALVQRFSETHIKENLLIPDKSGVFGYTFANCLELFNTIVKAIDEKIYKDIEEVARVISLKRAENAAYAGVRRFYAEIAAAQQQAAEAASGTTAAE